MVDAVCSFIIGFCSMIMLMLLVLLINDAATNGLGDCSDDPKYCVTPQELEREWPQFKELLDATNEGRS